MKGRKLPSTGGVLLRPTSSLVRGAIFSILGPESVEGARVLDLFSGTGTLGIEALSRGAKWVDFVEKNPKLCARLKDTLKELAFDEKAHIHCAKVEVILASLGGKYDIVFMDPPYADAPIDEVMASLDKEDLVDADGSVLAEHSRFLKPKEEYGALLKKNTKRYGDTCLSIFQRSRGQDG